MLGFILKDTQPQQVVDKTMRMADKDEDEKIRFEEIAKAVEV